MMAADHLARAMAMDAAAHGGGADPSDCYTKSETDALLGQKVSKIAGKGLSAEDFTTAEKTKLAGIESGATRTIVDAALNGTSTNPVQNKAVYDAVDPLRNLWADGISLTKSSDLNSFITPMTSCYANGSTMASAVQNSPYKANGFRMFVLPLVGGTSCLQVLMPSSSSAEYAMFVRRYQNDQFGSWIRVSGTVINTASAASAEEDTI